MKKLIIILLFIPSLAFGQMDKVWHAGCGAMVGSFTYVASNSFHDVSNTGALIAASSAVITAGALKEFCDYKPDMRDFLYTELGGAIGITATHFLTRKYFNKLAFYFDTQQVSGKRYNYLGIVKRF